MVKKALAAAGFVVAVILAVALLRALTLPSRQMQVEPAEELAFELDAALGRFQEAVRIATISWRQGQVERTALSELHGALAIHFPRVHAQLTREVIGEYSLLYTWPGRDPTAPPVVLLGHLDVVPVDPESADRWTHPPFAGVLADGFLWGRGTMDDKVNVYGILEAVELALTKGFRPARTVLLAFGHDEEVGGRDGAVQIVRTLASRGVAPALVLDEGMAIVDGVVPGVAGPAALVGIAEKGYVTFELVARGEGGHSSMPPRGGPVSRLAHALVRLEEEPLPGSLTGPARQFLTSLAPEMPLASRFFVANLWLFEPLIKRQLASAPGPNALLRTTTAMTMLEGSPKDNVIPTTARATVNFRIHPNDSVAAVRRAIERIIDDPRIEIREAEHASEPSAVSPIEGAAFQLLARTIREVFPATPVAPTLVLGATDSRHYAELSSQIYRFTPMVLGPRDLERIHGIDERIAVEGYRDVIQFYGQLLRNLSSGAG